MMNDLAVVLQEKESESRRVGILSRKARELKRSKKALEKLGNARTQTSAIFLLQVSRMTAAAVQDDLVRHTQR
jgi:hypothetical protein